MRLLFCGARLYKAIRIKQPKSIGDYYMNTSIFEEFVAKSRYCKWNKDKKRRETWEEAVSRYFDYIEKRFDLSQFSDIAAAKKAMLNKELFGSMRVLMTAGDALDRDDVAAYNCAYIAMNLTTSFRNLMYALMSGTGVGFSVETEEIHNLPTIPSVILKNNSIIKVEDSREGWAEAYYKFIENLYQGHHLMVDTSFVRPAGSPLKTFGGRASGPEPLIRLIKFTASIFNAAAGRRLKPIEVHDIVCKIADCVVCGGVRRSALISLSDLHDKEMATAKSGQWYNEYKHRSLANNSSIFTSKPSMSQFISEWTLLYDSKSGERGVCNREAMKSIAKKAGRNTEFSFGTNPCSEIILRPNQFCNLSTVVCRPEDTLETLNKKIELATILGTIQSCMTRFTMFSAWKDNSWKENCEEERLLGVSITGLFDHPVMSDRHNPLLITWLEQLKKTAHETNRLWASTLGIPASKSITCIKPEGTTSCVAGSSSGLHPRHSEYYIRRVRLATSDPMCQFMIEAGVPNEQCLMNPETTHIFSFPVKSPNNRKISAIDHLELWLLYQRYYCDHKPSITISYKDKDFLSIGQWIYNNWDEISGISFLPEEDHVYLQSPFEAITKEEYQKLENLMPTQVNWESLSKYENDDSWIEITKTLSCAAGGCEVK
jgi:ribonucleoside-triphosphate reductase (thioredoxin)